MIGEERTLNSKLYSILQTVHKWRTKGVFTFLEGPPVAIIWVMGILLKEPLGNPRTKGYSLELVTP